MEPKLRVAVSFRNKTTVADVPQCCSLGELCQIVGPVVGIDAQDLMLGYYTILSISLGHDALELKPSGQGPIALPADSTLLLANRDALGAPIDHPIQRPTPGLRSTLGERDAGTNDLAPGWRFDANRKHPHLLLDQSACAVRSTQGGSMAVAGSVLLERGVHAWDVILHQVQGDALSVVVGVLPLSFSGWVDDCVLGQSHGWGFACHSGQKLSPGYTSSYAASCALTGQVLRVTVDCEKGTLAYHIDGEPLGIAFTGLVMPVWPAISLRGTNFVEARLPSTFTPTSTTTTTTTITTTTTTSITTTTTTTASATIASHAVDAADETDPEDYEELLMDSHLGMFPS